MGTAKDIIDLVTQLSDSIQDRKVASELFKIIALANQLQADNFNLQKEVMELKKEIQEKQQKLDEKNIKTIFHANLLWLPEDPNPYCPACYGTSNKMIHMINFQYQDITRDKTVITKHKLRCPNCKHIAEISSNPQIGVS
jgi:hypothetical protein